MVLLSLVLNTIHSCPNDFLNVIKIGNIQNDYKTKLETSRQNHITSMHSSRMCTAHCSLGAGGGSTSGSGEGSASGPGGVCLWSLGVGGCVCVSQHAMGQTPPPGTEFLAHASENITVPQLRCGR